MFLKRLWESLDDDRRLIGAITDGDLRRVLERGNNMMELSAVQVMTPNPKWILDSDLAVHALATMEDHAITALFVMTPEDQHHPCGLIHIHDVLKTGIRR